MTNRSVTSRKFQVLVEVPEGSIPVATLAYTKSHELYIKAYMTEQFEYFFYFPHAGKFKIYPANIATDGNVQGIAQETTFNVSKTRTNVKLETLGDIIRNGSSE